MFQAYGLYSHISANRLRTIFLLAGFVVLLVALMFSVSLIFEALSEDAPLEVLLARAVVDVKQGWPIALGGAALWFCIAFLFHQSMIDYATGSEGVSRKEAPRLYNLLENLCISRGIPIPTLKIIDDEALNAFASGIRDGHYSVSVTRGLLARLNDAELEAVLGHELTHIRNRDTQVMVVATIFAGIFAFVGDLMFRSWNFPFGFSPRKDDSREERGGGGAMFAILIALLVIALSCGASVLIRFAISRTREFLADAGSVELTKNPDAMISALRKIEAQATMEQIPSRMRAFFIESPALLPESGFFATHPSVDKRVAALIKFAGGRDLPLTPLSQSGSGAFLPPEVQSSAAPRERGPWG